MIFTRDMFCHGIIILIFVSGSGSPGKCPTFLHELFFHFRSRKIICFIFFFSTDIIIIIKNRQVTYTPTGEGDPRTFTAVVRV